MVSIKSKLKQEEFLPSESTEDVMSTLAEGEKQHPVIDIVCALQNTNKSKEIHFIQLHEYKVIRYCCRSDV